jgi:hypothetical protein
MKASSLANFPRAFARLRARGWLEAYWCRTLGSGTLVALPLPERVD